MNESSIIAVSSLIYTILLMIVYFYKKILSRLENKIYISIMVTTFISIILFLITFIFADILLKFEHFNSVLLRLYLVSLSLWITIFTIYTYATTKIKETNQKELVKKYIFIFGIIAIIIMNLIFTLPMEYKSSSSGNYYIGGPSVFIVYIYSLILIVLNIYYLLKNIKVIGVKKFLPLIAFIVLGIVAIYVTIKIPSLLLITPLEAFITFVMYFTLENPDIKVIEEFKNASENMTKLMSEKELFQYNVAQKTKYPLKEIKTLSTEAINLIKDNPEESEELMKEIWEISNDLSITIDNTINLETIDKSKIKTFNTKYNLPLLLSIIEKNVSEKLKDTSVELMIHTSPTLPKYLYGDSAILKEALNIIIDNSIKHTTDGYIAIDTNYMTKDDICRITFIIEDSGTGLTIKDLEKTYNNNDNNIQKDNIIRAKQLLSKINGTLLINTKIGKGSKITIIVEQKIVLEEKGKLHEDSKIYFGAIKVLVIDNIKKEQNEIKKELSGLNIHLDIVDMGVEGLNKVRNKELYDIIFIKKDLPILDGIEVYKKFKKIDGFNIPTYLLEENEINNEELLNNDFRDVISIKKVRNVIEKHLEKN